MIRGVLTVKRRGYGDRSIVPFIVAGMGVSIVVGWYLNNALIPGLRGSRWELPVFFFCNVALIPAIVFPIVARLPARRRRHRGGPEPFSWIESKLLTAGAMAFLFGGFATWLFAACLTMHLDFAWAWVDHGVAALARIGLSKPPTTDLYVFFVIGLFMFGTMLVQAPRLLAFARSQSAAALLKEQQWADVQGDVLYLRGFDYEHKTFGVQWNSPTFDGRLGVSIDVYLKKALEESVGTIVALGNPADSDVPEGARRLYCSDETWSVHFTRLAEHVKAILLETHCSEIVLWELTTIRARGWSSKLFVLTPPRLSAPARMYMELLAMVRGRHPASWQQFSQLMNRAGFTVSSMQPPSGSMVTFDSEGKMAQLLEGAQRAEDYATGLREHLARERDA